MSIDSSLKRRGGMAKTRSVLKRDERIARLVDDGRFNMETSSPMGLTKTKVRHSRAGAKAKKAAEEKVAEGAVAAPEAAAAPAGKAPVGKGAAGAKAAPAAAAGKAPAAAKPAGKAK